MAAARCTLWSTRESGRLCRRGRTVASALSGAVPRVGPRILGGMDGFWIAAAWTLLPTVVVSALFFWILRSILHADRNERRAYTRIEAQERAKRGLPPASSTPDAPPAPAAGR